MDIYRWLTEQEMNSRLCFEIYRLKPDRSSPEPLSAAYSDFQIIYAAKLNLPQLTLLSQNYILQKIFDCLNTIEPSGYSGARLHKGDIIVLRKKDKRRAYYIESNAFRPCANFLFSEGIRQAPENEFYKS